MSAGEVEDPLVEAWTPPADLSAREVCELPLPEGPSVWGPVWPGYRLIVAGDPGQGKTTLTFAIVNAVAHGRDFLGAAGCGGTVLVFDTEMGLRSVQVALKKARLHESEAVRYFRAPDGLALDHNETQLAWMVACIERHQPVMVVIDPLYKAHEGDSNDERAMIALMRKLDRVRDTYGFVLVIPMHLRKTDPKVADFGLKDVFGSGAFTRGPEVVVGIRRRHPGTSRLLWLKDRDGEMNGHWNLTYSQEKGYGRDKDDAVSVVDQITDAFLVGGGGAMTLRQIAQAIERSERRTKDHLTAMIEDGFIELAQNTERGRKMYVLHELPPTVKEDLA